MLAPTGGRIDLVVRTGEGYEFYEIKTYGSARACIREAIGQLLEYAMWPGAEPARQDHDGVRARRRRLRHQQVP
jgi:hypothetical protein